MPDDAQDDGRGGNVEERAMQKMLVMKQMIEVVEAYSPIQERLADDNMQEAMRDGARSTSATCEFGQLNFSTSANFLGVLFLRCSVSAPDGGRPERWGSKGGDRKGWGRTDKKEKPTG